jgi:pimeloyl-ACP methyl ester carboxylesterase
MPHTHANGLNLYYEESGRGEPLLLIMGLSGRLEGWALQRPVFAEKYRTIVFDNRGAGRSQAPAQPWTMADMADDAAALLDALGIKQAYVVGASMGGMVAQELALRHPECIKRLVIAISFACADAPRQAWVKFRRWAREQEADPQEEFVANLPWIFTPTLINDTQRLMPLIEQMTAVPPMSAEVLARSVGAILQHDTRRRLHQIRVPTLVLVGAEDVLTPPFFSEEMAAAIPGAELKILPRGNHGIMWEYPQDFDRAVLEFLGR